MIYTTTHSRAAFSFLYNTRSTTTTEGVEESTRGPGRRTGSTLPMPQDGVVSCAARLKAFAKKSWVPILRCARPGGTVAPFAAMTRTMLSSLEGRGWDWSLRETVMPFERRTTKPRRSTAEGPTATAGKAWDACCPASYVQ